MDKAKSTPVQKDPEPADKGKKKGPKKEEEPAKVSLGFGPLGALGGNPSQPVEEQVPASNLFSGPNPFQNLNNQF